MRSRTLKIKEILIVMALLMGGAGASYALVSPTPEHAQLEARAQSLFRADASKIKKLPSGELVALSMALNFKNYQGAEIIVNRLERF